MTPFAVMAPETAQILIATLGGVVVTAIGAIIWALKYSMKASKEISKDAQAGNERIAKDFKDTVDNHMESFRRDMNNLTEAINDLRRDMNNRDIR